MFTRKSTVLPQNRKKEQRRQRRLHKRTLKALKKADRNAVVEDYKKFSLGGRTALKRTDSLRAALSDAKPLSKLSSWDRVLQAAKVREVAAFRYSSTPGTLKDAMIGDQVRKKYTFNLIKEQLKSGSMTEKEAVKKIHALIKKTRVKPVHGM